MATQRRCASQKSNSKITSIHSALLRAKTLTTTRKTKSQQRDFSSPQKWLETTPVMKMTQSSAQVTQETPMVGLSLSFLVSSIWVHLMLFYKSSRNNKSRERSLQRYHQIKHTRGHSRPKSRSPDAQATQWLKYRSFKSSHLAKIKRLLLAARLVVGIQPLAATTRQYLKSSVVRLYRI